MMTPVEQRGLLRDWAQWMMRETQARMRAGEAPPPCPFVAAVNGHGVAFAALLDWREGDLVPTLRALAAHHQASGVAVFADGFLRSPDGRERIGEALTATLHFADGQSAIYSCAYTRAPIAFAEVVAGEGGFFGGDIFPAPAPS